MLLKVYSYFANISKNFSSSIINGKNVEIDKVESFPDEIEAFWDQARKKYPIIIERPNIFEICKIQWKLKIEKANIDNLLGKY